MASGDGHILMIHDNDIYGTISIPALLQYSHSNANARNLVYWIFHILPKSMLIALLSQ